MGLFDKFMKKENKTEVVDRISIFDTDYPIDKNNWFWCIQQFPVEHMVFCAFLP